MIGKKSGKSCFKKFVLVANKTDFESLNSTRSLFVEQKKEKSQQQIIVPRYEKVQPICPPKNKFIPQHYIKVIQNKVVVPKFHYELDSIDLNFYKNNFSYLPEHIFVNMIVRLQKMAYKNESQINYKKIIQKCLNGIDLDMEKDEKQHMMKSIYNFWRNKRRNFRSPLVRQFWIKTEVGPFKSRQNCSEASLCLRNRTVKVEDWYIREVLKQDLLILKEIFKLMKLRQRTERRLIKCQTESFQKSCKKVIKAIQKQQQYQNQNQQTISVKNLKELQNKRKKRKQSSRHSRQKIKCNQKSSIVNSEKNSQDY